MTVKTPELRGLDFARLVIAKAVANREPSAALHYAEARWGTASRPAFHLKAIVGAATTTGNSWAGPLADLAKSGAEFFALAYERSIPGRMAGIRRIPIGTRATRQSAGASAAWVGQGQAIPITSAGFAAATLPPLKIAAMAVATEELIRFSDPDAEMVIRDDLVAAVSEALDVSFSDPSNAGVSGVSPASVTNGAPNVASNGNDLSDDLKALVSSFDGDLARAYFIGNPNTLVKFNSAARPLIGARGGEMLGIPAVSSRKVSEDILALVDAGDVAFASGETDVNASREASVQLETAPDSPATASTVMISLWQNNLVALQATQIANWSAGSRAAAVLTGLSPDSPA